jgi:phosphoserine aminotransferase
MLTFYPGPSKLYPQIEGYLQDGFRSGILQMNHRSQAFMDLLKECIEQMKMKLNIPPDYTIYFTSSATECWEILSQSLVKNHISHYYNGAFGKKWAEYSSKLNVESSKFVFDIEDELIIDFIDLDADVICITQNETSNGTQLKTPPSLSRRVREGLLIAYDVTSSMAGIELDWTLGDVWLASVQKCFGLPAGMGVMVCSPKALQRAIEVNDRRFYNSFLFIHENFSKYQTHYTPNILTIYLMLRVMQQVPDIQTVSSKTKQRAKDFYQFIERETDWNLLIKNQAVWSDTVIAIEGSPEQIKAIKQKAQSNKITLGNGYGDWKNTTFRIANFPAIEDWEFEELKNILITRN